MFEIETAREQHQVEDVSEIGLVSSTDNLTDSLTNAVQQASLRKFIGEGKLVVSPVQTIKIITHNAAFATNPTIVADGLTTTEI